MRKKLLWSALIIGIFWLILQASSASANCPSGVCDVEINATTGVITWRDAQPQTHTPILIAQQPNPTHTLSVQTNNQSVGISGTPNQIAEAVEKLTPQPLVADPCLNGGCTKIEVNATTGITTISPLTDNDLKQRAKDQVEQSQRQAELAKTATQALPNITAWQPHNPLINEPTVATELDETVIPDWWENWIYSFNLFFENWFWWWSL